MDHISLYLKRGRRSVLAAFIFTALLLTSTQAAWAYTALIYSPAHPGSSYTVDFNSIDELFNTIKADPPANHIPGFDAVNDPLKLDINYAGAQITVDVPAASTDVTVAIPALGYTGTFTGATRDAALTSAETEYTNDPNGIVASLNSYVSAATSAAAGKDNDGPCFIATAAYGSLMEPHVKILRDFRNRFLLNNSMGKAFVQIYYTYSPPAADFIAEHANLRAITRLSLLPIVGMSWVALKIGPVYSLALMLFLVSGLIGIVRFRKKSKK